MASSPLLAVPVHRPLPLFLVTALACLIHHRTLAESGQDPIRGLRNR